MSAPYWADYINAAQAHNPMPSTVHHNSIMFTYFQRHLLHKVTSVFKWTGIPDSWDKGLFLYSLYCMGHVAIVATDTWGIIPQPCTLSGIGVQYQPTRALIANPLLQGVLDPVIGVDCAVIRIMPDWGGLMDVVNHFASLMAQASELYSINAANSQLSYVFGASDKRGAESWKKAYDRIRAGEGAVFIDAELMDDNGKPRWQLFLQDVKQNYIGAETLESLRKLECMFDNAVGIPSNMATAKKERTISAEVEANDIETMTGPVQWLEYIQKGLQDVKRLFGLTITCDWRWPNGNLSEPAGTSE